MKTRLPLTIDEGWNQSSNDQKKREREKKNGNFHPQWDPHGRSGNRFSRCDFQLKFFLIQNVILIQENWENWTRQLSCKKKVSFVSHHTRLSFLDSQWLRCRKEKARQRQTAAELSVDDRFYSNENSRENAFELIKKEKNFFISFHHLLPSITYSGRISRVWCSKQSTCDN